MIKIKKEFQIKVHFVLIINLNIQIYLLENEITNYMKDKNEYTILIFCSEIYYVFHLYFANLKI
jgi:hypothetical protein